MTKKKIETVEIPVDMEHFEVMVDNSTETEKSFISLHSGTEQSCIDHLKERYGNLPMQAFEDLKISIFKVTATKLPNPLEYPEDVDAVA